MMSLSVYATLWLPVSYWVALSSNGTAVDVVNQQSLLGGYADQIN